MILPKDFEDYTKALMGDALYAVLKDGLAGEAVSSIRINPFKNPQCHEVIRGFAGHADVESVPWCPEGFSFRERPNFTFDPLFHAGLYYVQESSSMFVSHILRQLVHEPVAALDLCAAPGGKTTAARAVLPEGSLLFTNEPMKLRASVLSENVQKFGHPDMVVTCNFPADYRKSGLHFDVIIADVPCSGEGMFRKDEAAIGEWSVQNVEKCRKLQRTIVEDIWPCLREGGLLIYSTCTFNAHENEENARWIAETLGADFVEIETHPDWHITGSLIDDSPVCRFIPGRTPGDGLFVAVLRKHGEGEGVTEWQSGKTDKGGKKQRRDKAAHKKSQGHEDPAAQWLKGDYVVTERRGEAVAIPVRWYSQYEKAAESLRVLHAGVTLGVAKGRDVIPDTSLALSADMVSEAFPRVEVNYETAINYLRKEAIVLPADAPRGFVTVCFKGHALGFAKNVGNRANNLYPQEWKIKSTYLPETVVDVMPVTFSNDCKDED